MRHLAVATPPPAASGWSLELSDDFERADNNQTGWTDEGGAGGDWGCDGLGSFKAGQAYQVWYTYNTQTSVDDVALEFDHTCSANSANVYMCVRSSDPYSDGLRVRLENGTCSSPDGSTVQTGITYNANPTLRLEVVGSDWELFVDGVSKASSTTAESGGPGSRKVGINLYGSLTVDEMRVYT